MVGIVSSLRVLARDEQQQWMALLGSLKALREGLPRLPLPPILANAIGQPNARLGPETAALVNKWLGAQANQLQQLVRRRTKLSYLELTLYMKLLLVTEKVSAVMALLDLPPDEVQAMEALLTSLITTNAPLLEVPTSGRAAQTLNELLDRFASAV